jgi:hypothetical protein
VAVCKTGFGDCDANQQNGCETSLSDNVENCSLCGRPCEKKPNGVMDCKESACVIKACEPGFGNCNAAIGDGCEVDFSQDEAHCGACGYACTDGKVCVAAKCVLE